jgi:hypothetical protein
MLNNKRDRIRQYLIGFNIECDVHYQLSHQLSFYGAGNGRLPVTEKVYSEQISK